MSLLAQEEEAGKDRGQCQDVVGNAEIVLAGSKDHEVFGEVGGEEEEERR